MKQVLKTLLVLFITALCLNSDTTATSYATQVQSSRFQVPRSATRLSMNYADFVGNGLRPRSLAFPNWMFLPPKLPCESTLK